MAAQIIEKFADAQKKSVCVGYSGIREKLGAINLPKIVKVWIGVLLTQK